MNQSPLILVRRLDSQHDPVYGGGAADFLTDINAVAQIIQTSLLLFQGEWWNSLNTGLPLFQQIIGKAANNRQQVIALLIQQTILGSSQFVSAITNVNFIYNSALRTFSYACRVETSFGTVGVTFEPGNLAVLPIAT
jgi:hypothetical protein